MYFQVKIQVETEDPESGKIKKHTEQYIVEAISCLDAETRVNDHFKGISNFVFKVVSISESKIVEVIEA